ncbi:plasmid replication initiator TrfA [Geoalkalibacter subterraneus]|nr:plasmid replication initiator TrfA [Geoalkalibacter subterraneus]
MAQPSSLRMEETLEFSLIQTKKRIIAQAEKLPAWSNDSRAIPNEIVRSEVFGMAVKGVKREWMVNHEVRCWKGNRILFTGETLDQRDLDVWLAVLHFFRDKDLYHPLYLTAGDILDVLGKSKGKNNYERLKESMRRLKKVTIEIISDFRHFAGGFITSFDYDFSRKKYKVMIDPGMAKLFALEFTRIEWPVRRTIKGDLARWLHCYINSHDATVKEPSKIHLGKIKELARISPERPLNKVRFDVHSAMESLKNMGIVCWYEIDSNLLKFARSN